MLSNENRELAIKWITEVYKELDGGLVINTDPILVKLQCVLDILGNAREKEPFIKPLKEKIHSGRTTSANSAAEWFSNDKGEVKGYGPEDLKVISPKDNENLSISSEVSRRLKEMLKADEIKFNKIMEEFNE